MHTQALNLVNIVQCNCAHCICVNGGKGTYFVKGVVLGRICLTQHNMFE